MLELHWRTRWKLVAAIGQVRKRRNAIVLPRQIVKLPIRLTDLMVIHALAFLARAPNTVLTPHLGYSALEVYDEYYRHSIENALAFLDGKPMRVLNKGQ